jgi:hypothetical protein
MRLQRVKLMIKEIDLARAERSQRDLPLARSDLGDL